MKSLDSCSLLPAGQEQAMNETVKEIEWLLEDEIASALRTRGPVTQESLDKVANHVKQVRDGF